MLLDNRNQVVEDDQNASGNDTLYNAVKIGIGALIGYKAVKSGLAKDIIKPVLEVADTMAREGLDKAGMTMHTIKQWSNLAHLTPGQAKNIRGKAWSAAEHSLFRLDREHSSLAYQALEDAKNSINAGRLDFYNIRKLISGTRDDLNVLQDMLQHNVGRLSDLRSQYNNTSLYNRLLNFENFVKTTEHEMTGAESFAFRKKYVEEFVQSMMQSAEDAEQQLRETGLRKITLGDILEQDGGKLKIKEGAPIDISSRRNADYESLLDKFNAFISDPMNKYQGKSLVTSGDWQKIAIDSALRIDEMGKVVDYRMSRDNWFGFQRSLANDFKLPGAQFNPFKSLLGWDKAGRHEIFGGVITPRQIDPSITGHAGEFTIGDYLNERFGNEFAGKNIAVINGKAYVAKKDARGMFTEVQEFADGLKLHDITNADKSMGLKPSLNAERQMAGLDIGHAADRWTDWDKYLQELQDAGVDVTNGMKFKHAVAHYLDLGHQEARMASEAEGMTVEGLGNIDEFINKMIEKVSEKDLFRMTGFEYSDVKTMMNEHVQNGGVRSKNYKTVFGEGFESWNMSNGKEFKPKMYYAQREHYSAANVVNAAIDHDLSGVAESSKRFAAQFFTGREIGNPEMMSKYFTESSGGMFAPWTYLNALSEGIGSAAHQLGLSTYSKRNTLSMMGGLLLQRALPVYMLTQIPGVINYLSEPFFGKDKETGQPDNVTRWLMRGPVKSIDLGAHKFMDLIGATNVIKEAGRLTPGSDQFNETIPFVYALGLGQTEEERQDYIENGYDPIRKGRFWGLGNTPWTGTKIMYWRPNLYRRVQADVAFSDSKWGSRQEYYNNTWYPNPVNPLAPINHFVTNRHHYDKVHYYDRPYLQTSPEGQNIPIIGPLFSQTVGRVINPPQKMHKEYWQNGFQPLPNDEATAPIISTGQYFRPYQPPYQKLMIFGKNEAEQYQQMNRFVAATQQKDSEGRYVSMSSAMTLTKRTIRDNSGITFQQINILPASSIDTSVSSSAPALPTRNYDRYGGNPYEVYTTPSGGMSIVDVPDEMNLYNVNQDLQQYSINKIQGTNQRVDLIDDFQGPGIPVGNDSPDIDNQFILRGIDQQYNTLTDVAGLKGFAVRQFITGEMGQRGQVIEDSGYAYGWNNSFWNQNLGGLGGNLSEITRRFIPDRNKNMDYINPIRNTMPNWMPGSDYFTDFKHGDPYTKVDNGEERLPGEGYERLHGITGITDLKVGSSYLGYDRAYIAKHLIGQDDYTSVFTQDTLDKGTKIHEQIEKNWMDAGFAFSTEGKIQDKRNGILGFYDAMIHDQTSPTGVGIVDIKTTSAKKLDEIRRSGKPLEHHQKQVNYYLWATKNTQSNGYIYYVDKENLENSYMVGFKYDQGLLKESMDNLYGARADIKDALAKGVIGRGDLYKPLDRFRILADVAPYSQQFTDASAALSQEKLTPEEQEEASAIRERVKKQKQPLRVYPYKFKTSNLKSETVTVDKIINNNTIITKEYGKQHSIKFAGINVSESNTDMFSTRKETYTDKSGRKRTRTVGVTMNEAARKEIRKHIRPGQRITIQYDADERNKYTKDSTRSIRAVVRDRGGRNVNRILLERGLAKEKETDDSPAGIQVRYTPGEIAFGSAMERVTHDVVANIPFIGSKVLQVQSPYEMYRRREVYGKDFQSWNNPITGIAIPNIERHIGEQKGIQGILLGAFMGSLFGKGAFGKIVGATIGGAIPAVGKLLTLPKNTEDRDWVPKRRRQQEAINEYVDTLKYVKNMRLYEQYKEKAKREDHFDVERFMSSKQHQGVQNKLRQQELQDYKRKVKLDFKHRSRYDFKYGKPAYATLDMSQKETISAINKEIAELQSQRKVTKVPMNALKAIEYKTQADHTMYAYEPGDSLVNIMTALPKKERQYFKYFMDAPEEEKDKILRIAPSYLRRALQSTWGMKVDPKPSLQEYFEQHGLPDEDWIGWNENVNMDDVKVKIVHKEKADPGEFDIWEDGKRSADTTNIPIPNMNATNSYASAHSKLVSLLGAAGYHDIQIRHQSGWSGKTDMNIQYDSRDDVEKRIRNMEV